jgi:hypothetical protein
MKLLATIPATMSRKVKDGRSLVSIELTILRSSIILSALATSKSKNLHLARLTVTATGMGTCTGMGIRVKVVQKS